MSESAKRTRDLYPRLLSYAFEYKRYFFISFLGFVLFSTAQSLLLYTIELFINLLEGKPTKWVEFLPAVIVESVYLLPLIVIILSLARGIGYFFGHYYISRVGLNVVNNLRKQVFDHLLYLPKSYYDNGNSGEQISLVIYNIEQVTASVTRAVKVLFEDGLFLIGLLVVLFYLNWKLTLTFFAVIPVLSILVFIAARYFRRVSRIIQKTVGRVSHITNETIQGIDIVKSYTAEKIESTRFHSAANENLKYGVKYERFNAIQTPVIHFVIAIALAVIFLLVLLFWPEGQAGSAVVFVSAAGATGKPIKQLSTINSIIQRGLAAAESIFATIDNDPELNLGKTELTRAKGHIRLADISFAYKGEKQVLNRLNLEIEAGKSLALVGQSGSGKTTITSLLLRFYQAQQGTIEIDGFSINDITLNSLRKNISLVSQSPVIFDATVAENVCYGETFVDEERLKNALQNANAYDFVIKLENGVDTRVGESGGLLSGGQRQRIAIARALYKDAPILILDEATSALDNESEKLIQEALERLKRGRTTLIIAHRLSTVKDADSIVVLDQGNIIEQGQHDELLAANGAYASLYNAQSGSTS